MPTTITQYCSFSQSFLSLFFWIFHLSLPSIHLFIYISRHSAVFFLSLCLMFLLLLLLFLNTHRRWLFAESGWRNAANRANVSSSLPLLLSSSLLRSSLRRSYVDPSQDSLYAFYIEFPLFVPTDCCAGERKKCRHIYACMRVCVYLIEKEKDTVGG